MDAIDLAQLDQADQVDLDPRVFSRNLSALRTQQPELACEIEQAKLPDHWRAARALDDSLSFRIETPGEQPRWLYDSAAPATRADAVLRLDRLAGKNPATPGVGAGAELSRLLCHLSPLQAVFVFEPQVAALAAVLRLIDVSDDVASGRCVITPPQREREFLLGLLETHAGLLSPGAIVALPGVKPNHLQRVQSICEDVAAEISRTRDARLRSLSDNNAGQPLTSRLAVLALGADPLSHRLARELSDAGRRLGWETCERTATGPRDMHPLPHVAELTAFKPALTICVDHDPAALPIQPSGVVCQWRLTARDAPDSVGDGVYLAASPQVAQALKSGGARASNVHEFHWGFVPAAKPDSPDSFDPTAPVVLAGDLPNADAQACGVEQPTHKRLWAALRDKIASRWQKPDISRPASLLRAVERECGVELADRELRAQMVRIVEHVLIPAVVLERIFQTLKKELGQVAVIGSGWERLVSDESSRFAHSVGHLRQRAERPRVSAAVFAGKLDPLGPDLLDAAALGWPVLIHSPGGDSLTPALGGVLRHQQHYEQFSGPKELLEQLRAIREEPKIAERRRDRVRTHLSENHGYARRLSTLARELGLSMAENDV